MYSQTGSFWYFGMVVHLPSLDQTESVPYLIAEITSLLAQCIVKKNIITGRGCKHHSHTYAISTVSINQLQRVG